MADASLLKLELYLLIEKQKVRGIIQKKLLACYLGCIALAGAAALTDLIPWVAAIVGIVAFVALFFWGKRNYETNQYELELNRQALKDVYEATGETVSSEDIAPK